ncbi:MAG: Ig-like domain-containing protein [Candidatus Bathyarchaeota archaeon]|nr:Ig-like domain-containing protein [Candidatus Bathyarchaeota archaeon]
MGIITAISINSYPSSLPACQELSPLPNGVLINNDPDDPGFGDPLPGQLITVTYNGTALGTDTTDILGAYSITPAYILEAGTFSITASFAGDATYDASSTSTPITIQYCEGDADLAARLWISKWRVPVDIEADTYGGLLCIDPNGLRSTNAGPVIFVLDDLNLSPGLTEKSGVMRCLVNDNATDDTHPEGRVDMELLMEGTIWIQDNDEFWVGVQRGPDPGGNEPHGSWDPTGGGDGEGAGRQWLMGGYISKRYYRYGAGGDITAVIIGKDYMDVWKDQIFGTPSIPRNYTEATDLSRIAGDILDDVNTFQPLGWRYSAHPTYFPAIALLTSDCNYWATICTVADNSPFTTGPAFIWDDVSPGETVTIVSFLFETDIDFMGSPIQQILGYDVANNAKITQSIGVEWKKEFDQEASNNVMVDICDEASYEWRIDYQKRLMLYPRNSAPLAPAIRFTSNIRNLPEIVMGDTTESITHVIVTDATVSSIPPDVDAWCTNPDTWPDLTNNPRGYSAASMPSPANPADNIYADSTLIFDDEVAPALCFQNEVVPQFNLQLSIYRDSSGEYQYSQLHLDLREWQRLKFRFRHPTRTGSGNTYRLQLHTGGEDLAGGEFFNNRYQYEFGQGTQAVDTIDSDEWTEIELLLPEVDVDGNVTELNGWTAYSAWDVIHGVWVPPDPTDINWVSIFVSCNESNPGSGPGQSLLANVPAGDQYLRVANPLYFASGSTRKLFLIPNTYTLEDAGNSEEVRIRGVSLDSTPSPDNLELDKAVINNYTIAAGATVSVKGGWTICFSQFHFERKLRYEPSPAAPTPPYRYRMMIAKEMENLNEAVARADGIIVQEEGIMKTVRLLIDGDPRFEAGYSPKLYLDVDPYDNVLMFIDDIQCELGADLDFKITLTLGEGNRRVRELTEFSLLDAHDRQLRNLGLGRSKTSVLR